MTTGRDAKGKGTKGKAIPSTESPKTPGTYEGTYDTEQVAVALHYDHKTSKAPKVVATGRGAVAEQILQLAFANGVKVRQDADLAEILAAVDVDTEIPLEAFAAVAEILAYVYRANGTELPLVDETQESPAADTQSAPPETDKTVNATDTNDKVDVVDVADEEVETP